MHIFLVGTFEAGQHYIINKILLRKPELKVFVCPGSGNKSFPPPQLHSLLNVDSPVLGAADPVSPLLLEYLATNSNVLLLEVTPKNQEHTLNAVEEALFGAGKQADLSQSCGAVLVRPGGTQWETLLIRTKRGNWSFPKGRMTPGETEPMTASREIREETGIAAMIDLSFRREVPTIPSKRPGEKNDRSVVFYLAKAVFGEACPQLSEVRELKWVALSNSSGTLIEYLPDRQVFQDAADSLLGG